MHNHLSMLPGPYEEAPLFIRLDILFVKVRFKSLYKFYISIMKILLE